MPYNFAAVFCVDMMAEELWLVGEISRFSLQCRLAAGSWKLLGSDRPLKTHQFLDSFSMGSTFPDAKFSNARPGHPNVSRTTPSLCTYMFLRDLGTRLVWL